jgi:hypothetical protein
LISVKVQNQLRIKKCEVPAAEVLDLTSDTTAGVY